MQTAKRKPRGEVCASQPTCAPFGSHLEVISGTAFWGGRLGFPATEGRLEETRALQSQRKQRWVWTAEALAWKQCIGLGTPGPLGISNGILEAAEAKFSSP